MPKLIWESKLQEAVKREQRFGWSDRLSFYSEYSWGENILFDINYVNDMFNKSHIHLEQLEDYQRNLMRGIFPKTPFSGYQIEGQFIKPQVDNSI